MGRPAPPRQGEARRARAAERAAAHAQGANGCLAGELGEPAGGRGAGSVGAAAQRGRRALRCAGSGRVNRGPVKTSLSSKSSLRTLLKTLHRRPTSAPPPTPPPHRTQHAARPPRSTPPSPPPDHSSWQTRYVLFIAPPPALSPAPCPSGAPPVHDKRRQHADPPAAREVRLRPTLAPRVHWLTKAARRSSPGCANRLSATMVSPAARRRRPCR